MGELSFEKVKEGLWIVVGRGRVELDDRGTYFIGTDRSDDRWTDEELFQIAVFITDQWKDPIPSSLARKSTKRVLASVNTMCPNPGKRSVAASSSDRVTAEQVREDVPTQSQ